MAGKMANGLTPKQNKLQTILLKQIAETGETNLTQAGLQVYDTDNARSASVMVSQALENTNIKDKIEAALAKKGLTPDFIMGNLNDLASREVEKVSAEVKLKTNIELLKLMGAYPGSKSAHLNINLKGKIADKSYQEVKEELSKIDSELSTIINDTVDKLSTIEPTTIDE